MRSSSDRYHGSKHRIPDTLLGRRGFSLIVLAILIGLTGRVLLQLRPLRLVDQLTVHLDPADEQQAGLEADASLADLVTLGVGESIGPQVADSEADQDLLILLHGVLVLPDQRLGLFAADTAVEAGVHHIVGGTGQRRDVARQE